ncbi:unnamed protein product [Parnassius apollo]|uniref:(apollo) hypothetical protein n=1 Tax=Parnassius apollo TaxID=110799 RepID=A0A8S3YC15_PARAO|nr:unnamed protein product [Parnassius apollo]
MLPRSASQVGIIVVTERLENLNITREFTICREKVYSALRWLIRNNPLYKDVRIDDNAQISDQELVRLSVPELSEDEASERNENEIRNAFIPINNVARIIRASWHQGDYNVFTLRYASVQCSAMSLANIVRAAILSPNQWDVNILNANMLAGDSLYCWIRTQLDPTELDETGYLEIRNFHIVRQSLQMYECRFSIEYDEDTLLFGSLQDSVNTNNIGITLHTALNM